MFRWLLALLFIATAQAQVYEGRTLVQASLVADTTAIKPGQPFEVGLLMEMAPKWHTYWQYPGDAGLPTSIQWTLPEGFAAGGIQWPLPERIIEPGNIEVYAYGDQLLLITTITPPADLKDGEVTLKGVAKWLVCEELCIPGSADVEITLPVGADAAPANTELFARYRARQPLNTPPPYQLSWERRTLPVPNDPEKPDAGSTDKPFLILTVSGLEGAKAVDVFPLPSPGQIVAHPEDSPVENGRATVKIQAEGDLRGVLVVETNEGRQGWFVSSSEVAAASSAVEPAPGGAVLWQALLFGFLGGIILNLMPCVLPVISLKIFSFVRQSGDDPRKILRHGLAFVGGIFVFFLGMAVLIVALKSGGSSVSWGFQFQDPRFNLVMACLVFVFALNLFGVFEIILPGRAANALEQASSGGSYLGSFSQGVFATLLSTSCSAPFLGFALGIALVQPGLVIFAVFAAIAFGMGLPYILLSAKPGWLKILPKPGLWMERLKQFMGFPLMATAIWMLYILGKQKGSDGVIWASCFLLCLGLACWLYGTFCSPLSSPRTRGIVLVLVVAILGVGGWIFLGRKFAAATRQKAQVESHDGVPWRPFTQKALDALLAEGKPVFLDFTADWCVNCKVNEAVVLNTPAIKEAFEKYGVVPMMADNTVGDAEINALMAKYGRAAVPFYLVYPAGRPDAPIILPEILTREMVLDALAKAAAQ